MFSLLFPSCGISWMACLAFGALISATDPVSVLMLCNSVSIAPLLQDLITGESLMNDAIAIALYTAIANAAKTHAMLNVEGEKLRENESENNNISYIEQHSQGFIFLETYMKPVLSFAWLFLGSLLMGAFLGYLISYFFKKVNSQKAAQTNFVLLFIFIYLSYVIGEVLDGSGILTILFTSVFVNRYGLCNIDVQSRYVLECTISGISMVCELISFTLLGFAVFMLEGDTLSSITIALVTIACVSVARIMSSFICAKALNLTHKIEVPPNITWGLVACGLRGAVAFGLSKHARHDYGKSDGNVILIGTLAYALFSTLIIGPTVYPFLKSMDLLNKNDKESNKLCSPIKCPSEANPIALCGK